MFRENQPVQTLRKWHVGARVPSRAGVNRLKLAATEAAEKLTARIRVCLQAYRRLLTESQLLTQSQLSSSRAKRGIWVLRVAAEEFAFGWRSAFSAAIYALQSGTALAAEVRSQTAFKKRETNSFPRTAAPHSVGQCFRLLRGTEAAALIEFAVALPLLVVLIVGIFDFGGAFNLKQELSNAVREGARFGAAQPSNDVSIANLKPPSVDAVRFLVASYLQTAKINDCGLSAIPQPPQAGSLVWVYTASSGCAGTLTLTITRGVAVPETIGGVTVNILCTTVQISYPYQWHFNSVIRLLVPGANYTFTNIQSDATAVNMD